MTLLTYTEELSTFSSTVKELKMADNKETEISSQDEKATTLMGAK